MKKTLFTSLAGFVSGIFLFAAGCKKDKITSQCAFVKAVDAYEDRMTHWDQEADETQALLKQYHPRIFIAPESYLPVDFYTDYLKDCVLKKKRKTIHKNVSPKLLKAFEKNLAVCLDYTLRPQKVLAWTPKDVSPTLYGRIYEDKLGDRSILFLKYSPVFPFSGLPAKTGKWKAMGSRLLEDPKAWHELDIHGAVHVLLDKATRKPLGILLAQHNHHRVYLIGDTFQWPADNRVSVSMSQYSNEPYFLESNGDFRWERTVGDPSKIKFLFGRTDKAPLGSGYDKVYTEKGGAKEMITKLQLLALDDPIYTAWISLGEKKKIFGLYSPWYMQGPPGIDYYTFPALKNMADLTAFWFIDSKDDAYFKLVEQGFKSMHDFDLDAILDYQKKKLLDAL